MIYIRIYIRINGCVQQKKLNKRFALIGL